LDGRSGRVEERSQEIKNGPLSALCAKFASSADMPECGVIVRGKEKSEAMLAQGAGSFFGREINSDAQGFQNIRTAGLRCHRAVAMLCNRHPCRSANEGDCGGDVERIQSVASRAANVENLAGSGLIVEGREDGLGAEFTGEGGDFRRRFNFAGKAAEKIGFEFGGHRFIDQLVDGGGDLFVSQVNRLCELFVKYFQHDSSLMADGCAPKFKVGFGLESRFVIYPALTVSPIEAKITLRFNRNLMKGAKVCSGVAVWLLLSPKKICQKLTVSA
jgi:hypothetical protein